MKAIRVLSASAVSAVLALSLAVNASAATYQDVVDHAKACAVPAINVQQLQNFLEKNADAFTAEEYDLMIDDMDIIRDEYVIPTAEELGYDTSDLGSLTEDQIWEIGRHWSEATRKEITDKFIAMCADYGVTVDVDRISKGEYDVEATLERDPSSDGNNSSPSSSSKPDTNNKDSAVAPTGGEMQSGSNGAAVAFGAIATAIAACGIVVVAKKNRG